MCADTPHLENVRVLIVDDHEVVRRGLADLVGSQSDLAVVGEAASVAEGVRLVDAVRPDVAIVDARLEDGSGIELCRYIRQDHNRTRCLIITSYDDDEALFAAVLAGASGYVLKDVRGANLLEAVRHVAAGRSLLDPSVTGRVLARIRQGPPADPRVAGLTGQEHRILDLLADGLTNRQIAGEMHLAEQTVKNSVSAILRKLGMQRRTQAAVLGLELRERTKKARPPLA